MITSVKTNKPIGHLRYFVLCLFIACSLPAVETEEENSNVSAQRNSFPSSVSELETIQARIQSSLAKVKHTVVSIEAEDGAGSGVLVSSDGLILTAAHVIGESGREMKVVFEDGTEANARSLGGSELSDAGMLQLMDSPKKPFAQIAESSESKVGDWCFALGHPSGFDQERGLVLRVGRIIRKKEETMQTDCRLLGGDSGGPLFSMDGKVIGIHSRISHDPEENFHTTIESFRSNWDYFLNEKLHTFQSMQNGGFLGVFCEESNDGLLVLEVVPDTPADKAGIMAGDVLTRLDDSPLDTREKLTIMVSSKRPGSKVVLDYLRDSFEISIRLELGERDSL